MSGKKVRVKLRTIMAGDHGTAHPGDVIEVPEHVAEVLLSSRQAEEAPLIQPPGPIADEGGDGSDEPETATNAPDESAGAEAAVAGRRARLRRG